MPPHLTRIADQELEQRLGYVGAVLIDRSLGPGTTARRMVGSEPSTCWVDGKLGRDPAA